MTVTAGVDITEDEAKLYDRQIRLWGLDAQKRLRASKVLVYGMTGLGAEVVKNIVLAGIKSLTILDPETVESGNCAANFFVPKDKVGEKRATASLARAQNLNPSVEITAEVGDLESKDDDKYFSQFDVICVIGASLKQIIRVNELCRALEKKFFCGDTYGFYGFCFNDLVNHTFAEEVTMTGGDGPDGPSAAKMAKVEDESKVMKKIRTFTPFKDVLDLDWSLEKNRSRLRRMDTTYFVIQALLKFQQDTGRHPSVETKEEDNAKLKEVLEKVLEDGSVPKEKVSTSFIENAYGEISPICAIVGGVLGQEIIKACSHKDAPFNNTFLYNGMTSGGTVDCYSK